MIIKECQDHQDIYDFAIWCGIWDAAAGSQLKDHFFGVDNIEAQECRKLYELAYEMEQEARAVSETARYLERGFIRKWDDLHGNGLVEFVNNATVVQVYFNYSALPSDETALEPGDLVELVYEWTADGQRKAISIKKV